MATVLEFDKYRIHGAYHWDHLKTHPEYGMRVMSVCAAVRPGHVCLDLGCGDGAYMYEVAQRCRHVVGVDADECGVECARTELDRAGVNNYTLVHSSFEEMGPKMPKRHRRFDLIYSMDCIEHLLDPAELLDVMDRYLTARGEILIGTPLFLDEQSVSKYHVKEYTREELLDMFLPKFEMIRERSLPARSPNSDKMEPRFYLFHGRRRDRWKFWKYL